MHIRFFNNGTSEGGINRNLYVDYITLNGTKARSHEVDGF